MPSPRSEVGTPRRRRDLSLALTMREMDRIALRGVEVWAHHGATPREREEGQSFRVDVTLELDLASAAETDDLTETVDYGTLAGEVATAAGDPACDLLETVAGRVLDVALGDERVRAAEVTIHKPDAPLPVPAGDVAVTLRRERER